MEEEKPTYEDFEEHFGKNPEMSNIDLYEKFHQIPKSTLRYWKKKVLDKIKVVQPPPPV